MSSGATEGASWLQEWLDAQEIRSLKQFDRSLQSALVKKSLKEAVLLEEQHPRMAPAHRQTLAMGTRLDLSARFGCWHSDCLKKDLDQAIRRTWHFFDKVIVAGLSPFNLGVALEHDETHALQKIRNYADLMLYIGEIGASDLLYFADKRLPCRTHLAQHAEEAGMGALLADPPIVAQLRREASISVAHVGRQWNCGASHWEYSINHDYLDHMATGTVHAPKKYSKSKVTALALDDFVQTGLSFLFSDVDFARRSNSALGLGAPMHQELLEPQAALASPSVQEVAFDLRLPVAESVGSRHLLQLRRQEGSSFDVFRTALRKAMRERISAIGDQGNDSMTIAQEIADDILEPALNDIENKLVASRRLLDKTAGMSMGLGVLTTTIGLLSSTPITLGALVGAVVAAPEIKGYFSSRKELETSDFYFLWRAAMMEGH